ncbi:hypothetical protein IW492_02845 [Enterococcus sp. BWB1-3]|uniref:hypothetical protein n=1 Tax=Enterococcus sp. BWB1-3 TaxID=2787713 RepID=UPI001923D748|nr:hypothetical protein [Enterococcus sp. BWB1-3]MBL1228169.1 hypothetical protein [Enterococcus sp. BWB1-3]
MSSKFKKGDIVLNRWAGHPSVGYFIYLGVSGKYIKGLELDHWTNRIKECEYYKHSLQELFHDGEPAFIVVGHTSAFDVMKNDLSAFIEESEAE